MGFMEYKILIMFDFLIFHSRLLLHSVLHVAPACFYNSPEGTNQTLAQQGTGIVGKLQSAPSPLDATKAPTVDL